GPGARAPDRRHGRARPRRRRRGGRRRAGPRPRRADPGRASRADRVLGSGRDALSRSGGAARAQAVRLRRHRLTGRLPADARGDPRPRGGLRAARRPPPVRALRRAHPQAQVLLAGPWATVLGGQGLADTLVTYPRAWSGRLAAADVVRRLAPDTAVLLPNSVESALAAWYWGAGRRIGFDAGVRGKVLTDVVALPEPRRHQIDEYLMLAERCGASADDAEPTLTPPPA